MATTFTTPRAWGGAALGLALWAWGCSANDSTPEATTGDAAAKPASAQLPPTSGAADLDAWLAKGDYKSWRCEPAPHPARSPSAHSVNRICTNDSLAGTTSTAPFPEGAAAVKELYDDDGKTIVGYAVSVKTKPTSDDGASWYWYERIGTTVPAVGFGSEDRPKQVCVGCHSAAGVDADRTPLPGSRDYVYTVVP